MCTGAEIPAAVAAAAAGTAGAGAGAGAATEGAALTGAALTSALSSGGVEAGLLGSEAGVGGAGLNAMSAISPELMAPMANASPEMLQSLMPLGEESASPQMLSMMQNYSPEMAKMTGDTLNTGPSIFSKIGDGLNAYGKAQTAMGGTGGSKSSTTSSAPPRQSAPQAPLAPAIGGRPMGLMGQQAGMTSDSAKKKILQRMGLLGGM